MQSLIIEPLILLLQFRKSKAGLMVHLVCSCLDPLLSRFGSTCFSLPDLWCAASLCVESYTDVSLGCRPSRCRAVEKQGDASSYVHRFI